MSLVWSKHLECGPYFSNAKFLSGSERRDLLGTREQLRDMLCHAMRVSSRCAIRGECDGTSSTCAMRLTWIILLIKAVRSSDYYIPRSPREFLYVRAVIRQRHRSAVVLFLPGCNVGNRVEVLQYEKERDRQSVNLHTCREYSRAVDATRRSRQ